MLRLHPICSNQERMMMRWIGGGNCLGRLRRSLSPMVCTLVFAIGGENGVWGSGLMR